MTRNASLISEYDRAASGWKAKLQALGYPAAYGAFIARVCPPSQRVDHLLDAGCGTADFAAAYFAQRGPVARLTLLDPSREMLTHAARRFEDHASRVSPLCLQITDLPPHPAFDIILCAHVIEHCSDPVDVLRHLKQTLLPHGQILLVISKPHWCNRLIWLKWRHRTMTPSAVRAAVLAAGLNCQQDMAFAVGPPSRTSHAYLITHTARAR
jgi:ubiquinone/menaquinone biosynthesis C-methylase UbiE